MTFCFTLTLRLALNYVIPGKYNTKFSLGVLIIKLTFYAVNLVLTFISKPMLILRSIIFDLCSRPLVALFADTIRPAVFSVKYEMIPANVALF